MAPDASADRGKPDGPAGVPERARVITAPHRVNPKVVTIDNCPFERFLKSLFDSFRRHAFTTQFTRPRAGLGSRGLSVPTESADDARRRAGVDRSATAGVAPICGRARHRSASTTRGSRVPRASATIRACLDTDGSPSPRRGVPRPLCRRRLRLPRRAARCCPSARARGGGARAPCVVERRGRRGFGGAVPQRHRRAGAPPRANRAPRRRPSA